MTTAGVATDAKRLQQVLRNLLSNSFKFTEDGKVVLRVRLKPGIMDILPFRPAFQPLRECDGSSYFFPFPPLPGAPLPATASIASISMRRMSG